MLLSYQIIIVEQYHINIIKQTVKKIKSNFTVLFILSILF